MDVWSSANLQLRQEEDSGIREIKRLLENFPDRRPLWSELGGVPEDTKKLWTVWNELRVVDGVLYRESASPNALEKGKEVGRTGGTSESVFPVGSWRDVRWSSWYCKDSRSSPAESLLARLVQGCGIVYPGL